MSDSSEVGWLFIQQYYSKLNEDPAHLYQFYTKTSTLIHGTEGEPSSIARGQAQVQSRVQQQKFENCKVLVSSVDCLPSFEGGVVIQVLGEMHNKSKTTRFVQTFFLAQKPNGYYVLNDILRFLKDDEENELEEEPEKTWKEQDFGPIGTDSVSIPAVSTVANGTSAPAQATSASSTAPAVSATTQPAAPIPAPKKKEKKVFYSAYLKSITNETDQKALREALEIAGQVTHLQIEPENGRAFVDFIDQESLDRALALQTLDVGPAVVFIEPRKRRKGPK